jgi:glycerol-3-phosphate acyltransferase PlsY
VPSAWIGPAITLAAYLAGSISFARTVARRYGVDPSTAGSRNPGATNVGRLAGKRAGRTVLVLDMLKGALPLGAARALLGLGDPWTVAAGVAATLGHCAPIWHRFRGGRGAATAAGVMLAAEPLAGALAIALYAVLKKVTRRASVGSLAGAVGGALATAALAGWRAPAAVMAYAIAVIVWLRHGDNLVRLARGEEPES